MTSPLETTDLLVKRLKDALWKEIEKVRALEARVADLEAVIRSTLGEVGDFPGLPDDWPEHPFYWREWLHSRFKILKGGGGVAQKIPTEETGRDAAASKVGRSVGVSRGGSPQSAEPAAPRNPEPRKWDAGQCASCEETAYTRFLPTPGRRYLCLKCWRRGQARGVRR